MSEKIQKILIVDDERKIRTILSQILTDEGFTIHEVESGEEALNVVDSFDPVLILMDQNMPGLNGIETMERIRKNNPEKSVIILTAYGSIPLAVEAMKKGAYDYISKPFDNDELLLVINRALEHSRLTKEVSDLRKQLKGRYSFENIIGVCPKMQRMFEQMRRVCETNATVLIEGESGTGKELVAKALHYHSRRKDRPLVCINCGAIPENLLESEFFGHEKGAFTDAKDRKIGKLEQAHTGTLLLDEIGELPLDAQVKLLRVLEDRTVTRIGGKEAIPVDIRILAATNKNLEEEVKNGAFRLDLLYRLNIFTITVPPLRDRKEDIPLLAEHFLQKHNKLLGLTVESISKTAIKCLEDYRWLGNVRDMENAVQSAMILSRDNVLRFEDLPLRLRGYPEIPDEQKEEEGGLDAYMSRIGSKIEKDFIVRTLEKYDNNRTQTAEALQISRKTLFNKMKLYGIE